MYVMLSQFERHIKNVFDNVFKYLISSHHICVDVSDLAETTYGLCI